MNRLPFLLVLALWLPALPSSAAETVGTYAHASRIEVTGSAAFGAREILRELLSDPEVLMASLPRAPMKPFLEALEHAVTRGYQSEGFPDVDVDARIDPDASRIQLRIKEGPHYRAGPVQVRGSTSIPVDRFISRLTNRWELAVADTPVRERFQMTSGDTSHSNPPVWKVGEPAPFQPAYLTRTQSSIERILGELGFPSAEFAVKIVRNQGTASLDIGIRKDGDPAVIGEIVVHGNARNRRESILEYLGVSVGMKVPHDLVARLEYRAWSSARFLKYGFTLEPLEENRVRLNIDLKEYDKAPRLGQALDPVDQIMLKARRWVLAAFDGAEDFTGHAEVELLPNQPLKRVDFVLSRNGWFVGMRDAKPKNDADFDGAVLVDGNGLQMISGRTQRKTAYPSPARGLTVRLQVVPDPNPKDEGQFTFNLSTGFSSKADRQQGAPVALELLLAPAAFLFSDDNRLNTRLSDGVLHLYDDYIDIRLDAATGKPLRLRIRNEESSAVMEGRFEKDSLRQVSEDYLKRAVSFASLSSREQPVTGLARFIAWEILHLDPSLIEAGSHLTSAERHGASQVLDQLLVEGMLRPVDELFQSNDDDGDRFSIPPKLPESPRTMIAMVAAGAGVFALKYGGEFLAEGSWPQSLARMMATSAYDNKDYQEDLLEHLLAADDMGPVAHLLTARFLSLLAHPAALKFVDRGLAQMDGTAFQRDASLFLGDQTRFSDLIQGVASRFGRLSDEEVEQFAVLFPEDSRIFLRLVVRAFRANPQGAFDEMLPPLLDQWWEASLRDDVGQALAQLKRPTADLAQAVALLEQGVRLGKSKDPSDHKEAVGKFRKAAELGHPEAYFLLGQSYEAGKGVKRNFDLALNAYKMAGRSGSLNAQMALGNIYTDGITLPVDHVEAATWFALAAMNGNRLAAILFRSSYRKLDAARAAQVQMRVQGILKRQFEDLEKAVTGK